MPSNDFNDQASGTTVTTSNAGGPGNTNFDVTQSGTAPPKFDSTHAHSGSTSLKIATIDAVNECYVSWQKALGGAATIRVEKPIFLWIDAAPPVTAQVVRWLLGTTVRASLSLDTAKHILVRDSAGTTVTSSTSTTVITTGQWVRIEAMFVGHPTAGYVTYSIWLNADSTGAPDETITSAQFNSGGQTDTTRYGHAGTVTSGITYWLDDVATPDLVGTPPPVFAPGQGPRAFEQFPTARPGDTTAAGEPPAAAAVPLPVISPYTGVF